MSAVTTGRTVPREAGSCLAFLEACEITGEDLLPWFAAWEKVRGASAARELTRPLPAPVPSEELFLAYFGAPPVGEEVTRKEVTTVPDPDTGGRAPSRRAGRAAAGLRLHRAAVGTGR
ncbi:hypothetical protein [Streptomyces daliensis]|uniref:Uncharacterized protein n=1 Tax=Streptomyces daliensis TaxID=299421 RepID=A0A8T4J0B1_9ACTN|nr:hypothetical protein [Streptomyces daliensis]